MPAPANARRASLAPPTGANADMWRRIAQTWMLQANRGRLACTGTVTLTPLANSTVVTDARAGPTSHIGFMPTTANAAIAARLLTVQSQGKGTFAIAHTNNAVPDRTFVYCIMG